MLLDAQQPGARSARPRPSALAGSVALHAAVVAWMFFGPPLGWRAPEQARNLYQQVVAGKEKQLVWYKFRDKLPEVSPLERHGISRPPRAAVKTARQTIVANPPQAKRARQMVYLPAPPKELDHEIEAPNLMAFAVPVLPPPDRPPAKLFAPPPEVLRELTPPAPLPDAPRVAANTAAPELPGPDPLARPKPKEFVPPIEEKQKPVQAAAALPDAPKVATSARMELPRPERLPPREFVPPRETPRPASAPATMPEAPKVAEAHDAPHMAPRTFIPAPERRRAPAPASMPAPPPVTSTTAKLTLPPAPRIAPRKFVPPPGSLAARVSTPTVPNAPTLSAGGAVPNLPSAPRIQPRRFEPPPDAKPSPATAANAALPAAPGVAGGSGAGRPRAAFVPPVAPPRPSGDTAELASAPEVEHVAAAGTLTAAIVGLDPAAELKDLPEASRPAAFASAPKPSSAGGTGEPVESARLFVPSLMIRDGAIAPPDASLVKGIMRAAAAPTSTENLMEAARTAPILRPETRLPGVRQVPDAPDPRLSGRVVYMVAIQMPNVTSFTGSWTMWFADREPMPGQVREMRAPVPLRKVDPKYIASAAAERVEGTVQLAAVIRADGHVDSISVIKHLDDRLDFSAAEALRKWEFEPARRDGRAIDVDAIFEIPFRLEPVATR